MNRHKPTSHDVARIAGVSQTTVSYVMSGRRSVAPETERRVLNAMKELGYQPHSGARALRSNRSNVIGVVVPHHAGADPVAQHHFVIGLANQARKLDYDILLVTANEGANGLHRVINTALCDGLLILEVLSDDPRATIIAQSQTPAVFIGIPGGHQPVIAIDADYDIAGRRGISYLAERHPRRIHLLMPGDPSLDHLNFIERFRQAARAESTRLDLDIHEQFTESGLENVIATLETIHPRAGDAFLLGPLVDADNWCNALRDVGLIPGQDVQLIASSWDREYSHTLSHPSHFDMRMDTLINEAIRLLIEAIDSPPPSQGITHLIEPQFHDGDTLSAHT